MGDGIQKKYALIVNGDTEQRHLDNVEKAVKALRSEATYEISVASTKSPSKTADHFASPDAGGLKSLIGGLQSKMDDDDLLVVYVTGHGDQGTQKEGCVELKGGCYSLSDLGAELKSLSYGKRIVVMDQCQAGASLPLVADLKSMVITLGSPKEKVSCDLFSPFFWSDQVADIDGDGIKTVEERYLYAVNKGQPPSTPQFYSAINPIALSGKEDKTPSFKPQVTEVNNGAALEKELQKLQPGQLALVMFSADWCSVCREYQPKFEQLAKKYGGRFLMIRAEGIKGSEEDWDKYGIRSFPTVAFIDSRGQMTPVDNRENPLTSLVMTSVVSVDDRIQIYLRQLTNGNLEEKFMAADHLGALGKEAAPAIGPLTQLLTHNDPAVRQFAALALGRFGEDAASAVPELIKRLSDEDVSVQLEAIDALGKIGPKASAALPELVSLGNSITPQVMLDRLIKYGEPDDELTRALASRLSVEFIVRINRALQKIVPPVDKEKVESTTPPPPPAEDKVNPEESSSSSYNQLEIPIALGYGISDTFTAGLGFGGLPFSWLYLGALGGSNFSTKHSILGEIGFRLRPADMFAIQPTIVGGVAIQNDYEIAAGTLKETVVLSGATPQIGGNFRFLIDPLPWLGFDLGAGVMVEERSGLEAFPSTLVSGEDPKPLAVFPTVGFGARIKFLPNE